ncbi:transient receptor potential cation channel subfamily V member 5 isoform X2 [Esox lucius]|uniref:transient receptor potential cation channel subfamily V member 5 isoform X2 n=1 Tax=Esox lucius TaxID=8010 RepID=UPI00057636FF|nr:transient receptor potential cation channel subfamily V member 5 isoform X2 [Esox lucius]
MKRLNPGSASGHHHRAMEMELNDVLVNKPVVESQISKTSVSSAVRAAAQWANYTGCRWKRACRQYVRRKHTGEFFETMYKGLAWDEDVVDGRQKSVNLNKRLLDHFRDLAASDQDTDEVDLQYLNDVIADGADPNSTDRYGQTVLHEISRAWSVDVMRFFLERGADIRRPDCYGVTPLHVAAALDYEEMIRFLLKRKADIDAKTNLDRQTPLHYAAKNDAVGAVRLLLQNGADISAQDYKKRTPLQLAANLDRSEAARTLMELGADAGVKDSDGQLCITAMIDKMTSVAHLALNQFHVTDRMTRQQFYYLHLLEPEPPCKHSAPGTCPRENCASEPTSPLEFIVHQGKLDLIMHPVVLKLITVKWKLYGRMGAWILLLLNFLFIVSWTTVAISVSVIRNEEPYVFPEDWWRVFGVVVALGLTVVEVGREVAEMIGSRTKLRSWQRWYERRINDDLRCTHPMWPEEKHFLEEQIKLIRRMKGNYLQDPWNIFDWLVYILLMAVFGIHVADIFLLSGTLRDYSLRLFAVVIIFLWLRLMKHVRAFRVMGPFIVMLGNIVGDVLRFLFLYAEIFIPYACAFWIIFGGQASIPSMRTVPQLLYSLYRITLVDEYEFNAMVEVDSIMAHFLCGTFLALSSILCVNLMIALLSDTFQRVYDNALANAVMQQASIILQVEESMPRLCRFYDDQHIHRFCAPLGEFYDDDIRTDPKRHAEMKMITTQIKETLDEFLEIQKEVNPSEQVGPDDSDRGSGGRHSSSHVQGENLKTLQRLQMDQSQDLSNLRADIKNLQALIHQLIQSQTSSCVGCDVNGAESTGSETIKAPTFSPPGPQLADSSTLKILPKETTSVTDEGPEKSNSKAL